MMTVPEFESTESTDTAGVVDAPVGTPEESGAASTGHPAWQEILDVIPSSLHPIVTPALSQWDKGVQDRFQQVQSKYDPYKSIIENREPSELERALQVAQMIEQDPAGFYARMGQFMGQGDQGQTGKPDDDEEDYDLSGSNPLDPRIAQLEQTQQSLIQQVRQRELDDANRAAEARLDADLKALREKHGDFDEEYVIGIAVNNGGNLEAGITKYNQMVGRLQGVPAPGSHLPRVIAPGGATPSTLVDPTKLDQQGTKSAVVNLLQQMAGKTD